MKIVLACLITALVTAGGTEAAHRLITSKDIKNGTIQPVDLSAAAKKAMRGRQGIQGLQGPPGERGPAGFNSVLSSGNQITLAPNSGGSVSSFCPSGRVIGGGFDSSSPNVGIYTSAPTTGSAGTNGWHVRGFNFGGSSSEFLEAWVFCAG